MHKGLLSHFEMTSGTFKGLVQPDTYWVFDGLLSAVQDRMTEDYMDNKSPGEPDGDIVVDGRKAARVLGQEWVSLFDAWIFAYNPILRASFKSEYCPKEYNYRGDAADFLLFCPPAEYDHICKQAMKDPNFEKFLKFTYSSYDGFVSFYPDDLQDYLTCFNGETHGYDDRMDCYTKALVVALTFLVFSGKENEFEEQLLYNVDEIDFDEAGCMYFEPESKWWEDFEDRTICHDCHKEVVEKKGRWYSVGNNSYVCSECQAQRVVGHGRVE